jgi:predicted ester cyclase
MGIEENKRIAKEFTERLGRGDSSVVDELTTDDFTSNLLVNGVQQADKELLKFTNDRGHRGFPDYSMTVEDVVAEGDNVIVRSIRKGTNTGEFIQGIPPTGRYVEISRFALYRFKDGKISEMVFLDDMIGQYMQLGYLGSREEILKAYMEKQSH